MYTRQATAVLDSLRAFTGDNESAQALQAFANCNASLQHRGSVTLSAQSFPNRAGVMRPQGNGGGVSGVSRGGPAGGPGQVLRGGMVVPDRTQIAPPWGVNAGVGGGMVYPTASFYGGNYYGANAQGQDMGHGMPPTMYMTQIGGGGSYYDNSSHFGSGPAYNQFQEGNVFIDLSSTGGNYVSDWNTVTNNSFFNFPGPSITNNSNYNYGGETFVINGDTIINNQFGMPGVAGGGNMGGPAGAAGRDGAQGAAGDPGAGGVDGLRGQDGAPGRDGAVAVIGAVAGAGHFQVKYMRGVKVTPRRLNVRVVRSVQFNEETCEIEPTFQNLQVLDSVAVDPVFQTAWVPTR